MEVRSDHVSPETEQLARDVLSLAERLEAAERERDGLQHVIDCANTPLMRDVLRERDELARRNFKLRAYADYEYVADAELQARATAAESRVERLEEALRGIAGFDVEAAHDFVDEWTEAESFRNVVALARSVLLHPEEEGRD